MKTLSSSIAKCASAGALLLAAAALCFADSPKPDPSGNLVPVGQGRKCSCFDGAAHCFFDGRRCPSSGGTCNCFRAPGHADCCGVESTLASSPCGTCGGSGQQLASCAVCGGDGVSETGNTCQSCGGSGKRYIFCRTCGGNGRVSAGVGLSGAMLPGRPEEAGADGAAALSSCGLRCIEGCGAACTKPRHHKGFHKCGKGHTF